MTLHDYDLALTGGRWINVRGVQRWQPDPPVLHLVPDPRDAIACTTCGAKATQSCRTKKGHRTKDHDARQKPRVCRCGAELGWKRIYCDPCRNEKAAEKIREWRARRRAS